MKYVLIMILADETLRLSLDVNYLLNTAKTIAKRQVYSVYLLPNFTSNIEIFASRTQQCVPTESSRDEQSDTATVVEL